MDCRYCGYYWADLDEDGTPLSFEYCHYEGPEAWAPCEQEEYDEYKNEARIEEEEARKEAEFDNWLETIPEEQRPTNAEEFVAAWKQYWDRYELTDEDREYQAYLEQLERECQEEQEAEYSNVYGLGAPYDYCEF